MTNFWQALSRAGPAAFDSYNSETDSLEKQRQQREQREAAQVYGRALQQMAQQSAPQTPQMPQMPGQQPQMGPGGAPPMPQQGGPMPQQGGPMPQQGGPMPGMGMPQQARPPMQGPSMVPGSGTMMQPKPQGFNPMQGGGQPQQKFDGSSQGAPGGGQMTWQSIVQAVQRANPDAKPELIASAVDRFLPIMNAQSQQEWKQVQEMLRMRQEDETKRRDDTTHEDRQRTADDREQTERDRMEIADQRLDIYRERAKDLKARDARIASGRGGETPAQKAQRQMLHDEWNRADIDLSRIQDRVDSGMTASMRAEAKAAIPAALTRADTARKAYEEYVQGMQPSQDGPAKPTSTPTTQSGVPAPPPGFTRKPQAANTHGWTGQGGPQGRSLDRPQRNAGGYGVAPPSTREAGTTQERWASREGGDRSSGQTVNLSPETNQFQQTHVLQQMAKDIKDLQASIPAAKAAKAKEDKNRASFQSGKPKSDPTASDVKFNLGNVQRHLEEIRQTLDRLLNGDDELMRKDLRSRRPSEAVGPRNV